ncbi:hypothetical protein [Actinoplanes sp. G11-F43]|uniref:hypothetical protein n=1 Tax=Actinoplanes sp. G11-F43 TaxID=3424130 RepID=UPI003D33B07A
MSTWLRLQIASPFIVFPALFLAATVGGAYIVWSTVDSTAWRALTLFLCLMHVICVGVGVSIAVDRELDSFPWRRMVTVVLFLALSLGVVWVREMVQFSPTGVTHGSGL